MILGRQPLYMNDWPPVVMRGQMERRFNLHGDDRALYGLSHNRGDITDPDELALCDRAFNARRSAACHGVRLRS